MFDQLQRLTGPRAGAAPLEHFRRAGRSVVKRKQSTPTTMPLRLLPKKVPFLCFPWLIAKVILDSIADQLYLRLIAESQRTAAMTSPTSRTCVLRANLPGEVAEAQYLGSA